MEQSPRLSLSYVMPAQAQKHVTVNETFRRLDQLVQQSVLSRGLAAEPASPQEGDAYILPASPSGAAWDNFAANQIAAFQDGFWTAIAPQEGFHAWVGDADEFVIFDGAAWNLLSGGGGGSSETAAKFGINTTADATNKLAVKSDAILFNHDDVTPGNDDCRVIVNKKTAADTSSLVFQTGASGRAEFGLAGDDDFHVKVSSDGAAWADAILINKDTGETYCPEGLVVGDNATTGYSFSVLDNEPIVLIRDMAGSGIAGKARVDFFDATNSRMGYFGFGATTNDTMTFYNDNGQIWFYAGGVRQCIFSSSGGVVVGSPTGSAKGLGTINAEAVYDDNSLLSCYVFDQALDGDLDLSKWDSFVPDRVTEEDSDISERIDKRIHEPARYFAARINGRHDPLTLDGYARHWKEKRHLTSMPNESAFDPESGMSAGEWIQRLVETVEIQAVLIEQLNQRTK